MLVGINFREIKYIEMRNGKINNIHRKYVKIHAILTPDLLTNNWFEAPPQA